MAVAASATTSRSPPCTPASGPCASPTGPTRSIAARSPSASWPSTKADVAPVITELPRLVPIPDDAPPSGLTADHPMRHITRAVAFEPDGWTTERKAAVVTLFDSLADEWLTRDKPG